MDDGSRGVIHLRMTMMLAEVSTSKRIVRVCVALSAATFLLALNAAANPAPPSGQGLSRLALELLALVAGVYANTLFWGVVSVGALCIAGWVWRHTGKLPSDRWWR